MSAEIGLVELLRGRAAHRGADTGDRCGGCVERARTVRRGSGDGGRNAGKGNDEAIEKGGGG